MSTPIRDIERVAAYLDGVMTPPERDAFEDELEANAALHDELGVQCSIDGSLTRLFAYADAPAAEAAPAPAGRVGWARWAGLAAAVVLAGAGAWLAFKPDPRLLPPQAVYAKVAEAHFKPSWKCQNDDVFKEMLVARMGESFTVDQTNGVEVVGWSYNDDYDHYSLSPRTLVLINKVGEDYSLVLIDHADKARRFKAPASSGLHVFEEKLGQLVLYEITPREEPVVLRAIRQ